MRRCTLAYVLLGLCLLAGHTRADERARPPLVDPAIDVDGEPFCYFSRPTDQLGVMDGEHGFQVTAEGWLYTRRAEIVFLAGEGLAPVRQRVRTLRDGNLPILDYGIDRDGIHYTWTMFAATLDGNPRSPLFALVRMTATNPGVEARSAHLGVAVRHHAPRHGTARMRADRAYPWRWRSRYAVVDGSVQRDGRTLLFLPDAPEATLGATLDAPYAGTFRGSDHDVLPSTPVCPATWSFELRPGEARSVDLSVPLVPVPSLEVASLKRDLAQGAFDRYLERSVERWRRLFANALTLDIPERKAHDTFWTSFANVAIARDQTEADVWIQRVNELQYHTGFWPRDASYFMLAWWYMGLEDEARRVVEHYFRIQNPDGSFRHDPENISPFAIARWFFLTGDLEYAEKAFPYLWRNHLWLKEQRKRDPLHLMPRRGRYDNEGIDGHYTGHNFYNVCALREAAAMARALGKDEEAAALLAEHDDYRATFLRLLAPLVEEHGQIPPGLDTGLEGANWGNLVGSYPTEVLPPDHPWISRTSDKLRREKYEEGLLIYDAFRWWSLHHYSTIKNTYSDLLRGRDDLVVKDLYALLAHTSATNAGFEFCIVGWSNRDFGGNFSPHGWFAAKFIGLVRLMLVREEGEDLHLLSALPPAWVAPGQSLETHDLPTRFGNVGILVEGTEEGAAVHLSLPTPSSAGPAGLPRSVFLHVPWYAREASATIDGEVAAIAKRKIRVPLEARMVMLSFRRSPDSNDAIDYDTTVADLKLAYEARFAPWREAHPERAPFEPFPEKRFLDREERAQAAAAFRIEEGIAVDRPARASSARPGFAPSAASDGVGGANTPGWRPAATDPEPWWEVDLGGERRIQRVGVQTAEGSLPLRFHAEARGVDGVWRTIADRKENDLPGHEGRYDLLFPILNASRLRLRFPVGARIHLTEVHVFAEGPAWQPARDVRTHDETEANLALGRPTLSSEWEGDDGPWRAVDGRRSWGEGFWAGAVGHPQWWMVDLEEPRALGRARLYLYAGDARAYAWVLQSSLDGVTWRTLAEHRDPLPSTNEGTEVPLPSHRARYVRLVVLENTANPAAHVAELELYEK